MELVEIHSILISDAAVSTNDMGTFPYQMLVCVDDMGNIKLCQIHSISIQKGEGSYGIGMGLIHIIPIPDTIENLWNCAKYVAISQLKTIESKLNEDSGIYGFDIVEDIEQKNIFVIRSIIDYFVCLVTIVVTMFIFFLLVCNRIF